MGGIFHSYTLLKYLECCVECSIHSLFISLSNSCYMSLNTIFTILNITASGDHNPFGPSLALVLEGLGSASAKQVEQLSE